MTDSSDERTEMQAANARKGAQQVAERAAKAARVAAALRANLLKRKQQARARAADGVLGSGRAADDNEVDSADG